jgi:hypothetical protein
MHGNEATSKELLIHLIDYLLNNQENDPSVDFILKNTRVHILPSMNPDGNEESILGDCQGTDGRYNEDNIDLNRNFPDLFECNEKLELQPETKAIVNWLEKNTFVLSANFHSGTVVIDYPFDNYLNANKDHLPLESKTDDDDVFQYLSLNYSFNHANMRYSPCNNTEEYFTNGIINGAQWYPTVGSMQDFNYWSYGCYEITPEISCCKYPTESELETNWLENKVPLVEYLKLANSGIRGIISYLNGEPAKYLSVGIDNREPLFKTNENGEYYKLLLPGNYSIHVSIDCSDHIFHEFFELKQDLIEMNITLDINEIYEISAQLNKHPIFCEKVINSKCSDDTSNSGNRKFSFSIILNLFFILIILEKLLK